LETPFKKYKIDCKKLSGTERGTCSYMCDRWWYKFWTFCL